MLNSDWRFISTRVMETIIGFVLIIAGFIKAYEMLDSVRQVLSYNIITNHTLITILVWLLVVVECGLGTALVLGSLRSYVVPATFLLFGIFLAFVGWSWATGATANCGCFGSKLQHSPKEAFIFDAMLIIPLAITEFLSWKKFTECNKTWKLGVIATSMVLGLGVATYASFSPKQSSDPVIRLQVTSPSPFKDIKISDLTIEVEKGLQLIVVMDTGCDHCQANVPLFNQLFDKSSTLAPLNAICSNKPDEIKDFQKKFSTKFPIGRIADTDFFKLLEKGDTPRVFLLRDGKVLKIWDGRSPTEEEVKAALTK